MLKKLFFLILTFALSLHIGVQSTPVHAQTSSVVDSLIANMSTREKVAQLFIISLSSNPSKKTMAMQDSLIKSGVGSLILMRGYAK